MDELFVLEKWFRLLWGHDCKMGRGMGGGWDRLRSWWKEVGWDSSELDGVVYL